MKLHRDTENLSDRCQSLFMSWFSDDNFRAEKDEALRMVFDEIMEEV